MRDILQNVSVGYLLKLQKILNKETVKFSTVKSLIENHLQGSIKFVGSGSSHMVIKIGKYSKMMTSYDAGGEDIQKPSAVKGGLFSQHGKAHKSRKLCAFNLKLLQDLFKEAGITPEVVQILLKSKFGKDESLTLRMKP